MRCKSNPLILTLVVFLAITLLASFVHAQSTPKRGDTGTAIGTVREFNRDWILLSQPDSTTVRYWFKWVGAGSAVDKNEAAIVDRLAIGDRLEIHWSYDDRERIESAAPPALLQSNPGPKHAITSAASRIPAVSTMAAADSPGAAQPSPTPPAPTTLSERVNGLIDSLVATGERLLELPVFMLLIGVASVGSVLALIIRRLARRAKNRRLVRALLVTEAALLILAIAFMIDRKISRLQEAVSELRNKSSAEALARLDAGSHQQPESQRQSFLFDLEEARQSLGAQIGEVSLRPVIYDQATDIIQVSIKNPLAKAYVAVIDLHHPGLEIKLGANFDTKTLTSAFARENDCTLAINGEAGMSPAPGSGLGVWRGDMVRLGQVLSHENVGIPRPSLAFDKQNHAEFTPAALPDRSLSPDRYNLIWGRLDALVNGVVQNGDPGNRQPRTAMGISQDGGKLYLLVVDGRQPQFSMGFTRGECAQTLKTFGAWNGMLCDEGGSSCIYLKQFGGISNIPSDNQGQERATYTHFGISLRPGS